MVPTDVIAGAETYCPGCGYDLRGSPGGRCPECGLMGDAVPLSLPWERRRELGWVRSFARTAWLATVHPSTLARRVGTGVDLRSAGLFRRVVLLVVATTVSASFVVVVSRLPGGIGELNLVPSLRTGGGVTAWALFWSAGAVWWPVLPLGLALALVVGTAWNHWFDLRAVAAVQRQRAMVGVRYTVAPLIGLALIAPVAAALIGIDAGQWMWVSPESVSRLWLVAYAFTAIIGLLIGTGPARFALALRGGGAGRAAVVLVGTTVQWGVATGVGLGAFPAVVGFARVAVDSLR